ncbi:MAG TPA: PIG-L family deacetylase [Planctomycetota bacterium]|nr:PIG-L family deacetylase [Planctomycetota bacterium]
MATKTLLVIGAHMDDCEGGAGGTIFKAIDQGLRVVLVNTIGDFSNRPEMTGGDFEAARKKVIDLATDMGAEKIMLDYKYHRYPDTLEARREMARIVAEVRPDVAIIHHWEDYWSDHRVTGLVARDALVHTDGLVDRSGVEPCRRIFAFGAGRRQTYRFEPDTYVDVTPYIDRIAWIRFELDKVMSPNVPEEKYFRQHTRVFHPTDPSLDREMKLTAHAELQMAKLRLAGATSGVLYAEPFLALFKSTGDLW